MVRRTPPFITEGLGNILSVLHFVQATSDAFPPLKSAVSGVIWIADCVKEFKSNQEDWKQFAEYVQQVVVCIVCLVRKHECSTSVRGHQLYTQKPGEFLRCDSQHYNNTIISFSGTLEEIRIVIKHRQDVMPKSLFRRFMATAKDRTEINKLRSKLDRALILFHLGSTIEARNDLAKSINFIVDELRSLSNQVAQLGQNIERNEHSRKLEGIQQDARKNISRLEGSDIAPWDLKGTCLAGTRVDIVNDIVGFADGSNASFHDNLRVLLITGVAGSGKTTIAETARQRCDDAGLLVSSFNFVTGSAQKTPDLLISTIVRDIIRFDPGFEAKIGAAIANNPRIISASIAEKFRHLIQKPLSSIPLTQRMVIIIDALDEGDDENLIDILATKCTSLPSNCRLVITTRPFPNILNAFQVEMENSTVELVKLELDDNCNHADIAMFARHELRKLRLSPWPDESQVQALVKEAGGLFIWMCNYIRHSAHPKKQLQCIIDDHRSNLPSEAKLEKLYSTILSRCPWNDSDFEAMYQKLLGAVIALKSPLSAIAIKSLLQIDPGLEVSVCLSWLSPVLTGLNSNEGDGEPLQTLHPSFRRYITQNKFSGDEIKFAIDETTHSRYLALDCLRVLNEELPKLEESSKVSDKLWYSCRFWIAHLESVKKPSHALLTSLSELLKILTSWIALYEEERNFPGIGRIISWAYVVGFPIWTHLDPASEDISKCLYDFAQHLQEAGRLEESQIAIDGAVTLRRRLVTNRGPNFNEALAQSLDRLHLIQVKLGHREEALDAIIETVDLYRVLSRENPFYTPHLSTALHNLSYIQDLRHHWEEGLVAIQEAVDLRRKAVEDNSKFYVRELQGVYRELYFKSHLAESLNNLTWFLHNLFRDEDALEYARDAVILQRNIISDEYPGSRLHEEALTVILEAEYIQVCELPFQPITGVHNNDLTADLAMILDKKSACLANCHRHEDALISIHEAVQIRRQLAKDRPAAFTHKLAESLINLANLLADIGDRNQSLRYIQESVGLWRQLAEDEPTSFGVDFAKSLDRLALGLLVVGLEDEAANTQREAQEVRKNLKS